MAGKWKAWAKGAGVVGTTISVFYVATKVSGNKTRKVRQTTASASDRRQNTSSPRKPKGPVRAHGQRDVRHLENVYEPGTRVSPYIVGLLHPSLDEDDVARRCVDISHETQRRAYEYVHRMFEVEHLGDQMDRFSMIRRTLQSVAAPDVDWRKGVELYPYDGPEERVWNGIGVIVDIVEANHEEKREEDARTA